MKKILSAILFTLLLAAAGFAEERKVSFSVGLMTGIPFYGDSNIVSANDKANSDGGRIIIGLDAYINFNVLDQVTFFIGNDTLFDFNWNSSDHANHINLDFPFGVKFYPGLKGLNFGLAYVLGFRADFIKIENSSISDGVACWGNGVKFQVEYNFAHCGASRYLPSIGTFWKLMPRGQNNWDNMLCIYINANL